MHFYYQCFIFRGNTSKHFYLITEESLRIEFDEIVVDCIYLLIAVGKRKGFDFNTSLGYFACGITS